MPKRKRDGFSGPFSKTANQSNWSKLKSKFKTKKSPINNNNNNNNNNNEEETLSEKAENLLNAVIGVRKTLREKQHVLKGIALEKSESVEAAEVVFQQVTINQSLMNILEEKCTELQKKAVVH